MQAAELDVSVQLAPLFHKQVEINSLELKRPKVELVKDQKGCLEFLQPWEQERSTALRAIPRSGILFWRILLGALYRH